MLLLYTEFVQYLCCCWFCSQLLSADMASAQTFSLLLLLMLMFVLINFQVLFCQSVSGRTGSGCSGRSASSQVKCFSDLLLSFSVPRYSLGFCSFRFSLVLPFLWILDSVLFFSVSSVLDLGSFWASSVWSRLVPFGALVHSSLFA